MKKQILLFSLMFFSTNSFACKFIPDTRNYNERINEANVVFIGEVVKTNSTSVEFKVLQKYKGITTDTYQVKQGNSSCDIRFSVNDVWLYAGSNYLSPSRHLGNAQDYTSKFSRQNDSTLHMNRKWQNCQSNNECVAVGFGCSDTSVNFKFKEKAEQYIIDKNLDPRVYSCVTITSFGLPLCVKGECGVWTLR